MGHEAEWDGEKEIHQGAGEGNEDFVTTARCIGPSCVGSAESDAELAHGNPQQSRGKHMADLVEQEACDECCSDGKGEPPASDIGAKNYAEDRN